MIEGTYDFGRFLNNKRPFSLLMGRIGFVDAWRGLAVLMMIAYHFIFDLGYLGLARIDLEFLPLLLFQRATGGSFLLLAGISIWLSEARGKSLERRLQRFLKLALVALGITLGTWIYPHEGFITFGIIHLMALSALIGPVFIGTGGWGAAAGLLLLVIGSLPPGLSSDSPYLFWLGLPDPAYTALDYYPVIPWFGMVLLGIFLGRRFFPSGESAIALPGAPLQKPLEWIGRNSLAIYLVHQPVLIAGLILYQQLS